MSCYTYFKEEVENGSYVYLFSSADNTVFTISFDTAIYSPHLNRFPFLLNEGFGVGLFPSEETSKDPCVSETTMDILIDFLENTPAAFLLYHCDYNDGRQRTRNRLFNRWHNSSAHKGKVYKYNLEVEIKISEGETQTHYIGFICKTGNANIQNAIDEFSKFSVDLIGEAVVKGNGL